jgi:itaconate CoA-transferase
MTALGGLLVVALEQAVAAPLCTSRLADGGARVIKIERAGGETARHYDQTVGEASAYFAWLNRGKESLVADVKDAADRDLIEAILADADVFVQNLAPGAAARLGLDARSLVGRFPRLIAVDICGYGQDTSAQAMRAYDMLVQAESGICAVTGTPADMVKVGVSIGDIATGMNAHALVLEALIERDKTGEGRAIEVAMFDALADWMAVPLLHYTMSGKITPRTGFSHATIYPYAPFACLDDDVIIAIQSPDEWQRFCVGIIGDAALADDPRFADNSARLLHRDVLSPLIEAVFATLTVNQAIALLDRFRIAWGRKSDVPGLSRHPALRTIPVVSGDGIAAFVPRPPGRHTPLPGQIPALDAQGPAIRKEYQRHGS